MKYWFRTVLGLLLFFGAATAFDYSVFEIISDDPRDANRLVAAIPLAVVAALAGGALFSARGKASWQVEEAPGWAFAVPWWSFFFVSAGAAGLAAGLGLGGGPHGAAPLTGILIGAIFVGLGTAPVLLGLTGPLQRGYGGTAAARTAGAAGQAFIALFAVSGTLALMENVRDEAPAPTPSGRPAELEPVAPEAPGSLFHARALRLALEALDRETSGEVGIQRLRIDPNSVHADLETEQGGLQLVIDRAGQVVSREEVGPSPQASFSPELLDPQVCERIARGLERKGDPGLRGISHMIAIGAADDGRPGWAIFGHDRTQRPRNASIDGRQVR